MSGPDSSRMRRASPGTDRWRFERLALALGIYGPTAASVGSVRPLARAPLWLETRSLLREHGFQEYEINYLMGTHPQGCACWKCVRRLRDSVLRHQRKLRGIPLRNPG